MDESVNLFLHNSIGLNYPSLNAYVNMVQYTSYICKFDNRYFDEELKDSRYNGGFMRKTAGVENGSFGIWIISAVRLMGT